MTHEGFKSACQLAAWRLVRRLPLDEIGFADLTDALPREVVAKTCHSKIIGVATDDGLYSALYALDRQASKASGQCVYGDTMTLSRGEPGKWQAFDEHSALICEWTGRWDVRERPWFKARGWCRYEDPATHDVVESFVARFDRGVVICGTVVVEPATWLTLSDAKLASRILYTNPVVVVSALVDGRRNCMTLSWLTPVDNAAHFVFSMRATRHTARAVCDKQVFGLSVLPAGHEHRLLAIGAVSGATGAKDVDYFDEDDSFYVRGAVATVAAVVVDVLVEHNGHSVALAKIRKARVASDYWVGGKLFAPATPTTPPLLAFLGSQQFAHLRY